MKERKNIFDYLIQVLVIWGATMIILNILCIALGESAVNYSSLYQLGSKGIACSTMLQFLFVSIIITAIKFVFFTDFIIKKMSIRLRTIYMLLSIIVVVGVFCYVFSWFPFKMWQAWVGFLVCFSVCTVVSIFISIYKEKLDNKKLNDALNKLKEEKDE